MTGNAKSQIKISLTKEDKQKFANAAHNSNPFELLIVANFVEYNKNKFSESDLKFMWSHLGRKSEKFLRNITQKFCF